MHGIVQSADMHDTVHSIVVGSVAEYHSAKQDHASRMRRFTYDP